MNYKTSFGSSSLVHEASNVYTASGAIYYVSL